jgi:hypothetical protein
VHNNTDDSSDDKLIPTPLVCQGGTADGWDQQQYHQFTGDITGKGQNVAPLYHIIKDNSMQYFHVVFCSCYTLLVEETNRYCQQYLDFLDDGPSMPDVSESEMFLSLAVIIQMGHDNLKDYWLTAL